MPVANIVGQADNLLIDGQHPFWNGFQASGTPVGRISSSVQRASNILPLDIGQPAEIASAVTYFMSEGASFTTGQHLFVCGGLSIGFPML